MDIGSYRVNLKTDGCLAHWVWLQQSRSCSISWSAEVMDFMFTKSMGSMCSDSTRTAYCTMLSSMIDCLALQKRMDNPYLSSLDARIPTFSGFLSSKRHLLSCMEGIMLSREDLQMKPCKICWVECNRRQYSLIPFRAQTKLPCLTPWG